MQSGDIGLGLALEATNDFQIDAENAAQFDGCLNASGIGSLVSLTGEPFSGALILSAVFDRTGAALHVMTNHAKNDSVDGAVADLIFTSEIANRADHHAYQITKYGLILYAETFVLGVSPLGHWWHSRPCRA